MTDDDEEHDFKIFFSKKVILKMLPLNLAPATELSPVDVHSLPCRIDMEGQAKVDTYFLPRKAADDAQDTTLYANLRGRKFIGEQFPLPENCIGLFCKEDFDFDEESEVKDQDEDDVDFSCVDDAIRIVLDYPCSDEEEDEYMPLFVR